MARKTSAEKLYQLPFNLYPARFPSFHESHEKPTDKAIQPNLYSKDQVTVRTKRPKAIVRNTAIPNLMFPPKRFPKREDLHKPERLAIGTRVHYETENDWDEIELARRNLTPSVDNIRQLHPTDPEATIIDITSDLTPLPEDAKPVSLDGLETFIRAGVENPYQTFIDPKLATGTEHGPIEEAEIISQAAKNPRIEANRKKFLNSLPGVGRRYTEIRVDLTVRRKRGNVEGRIKPDNVIIIETPGDKNSFLQIIAIDYKSGTRSQETRPMPLQRQLTCAAMVCTPDLILKRATEENPKKPLEDYQKPFRQDAQSLQRKAKELFESQWQRGGTILTVWHQVVYLGGEKPEVDTFKMDAGNILEFLKGKEFNVYVYKAQRARMAEVRNLRQSAWDRLEDSR